MPLSFSPFAVAPHRPLRRRLLLAAAAALVAGCSQEESTPPLRLASNEWPGYEPLHLARERGYWGAAPIRLYELPSSSEVLRAMRNGALDGAALTADEALTLMADGIDLRAVLVLDISRGADALVARPDIRTLGDLKGRRIGVENQALGAYLLNRALESAGLSLSDVSVVPLTVDTHESAYLAGAIDAAVTFEPALSRLRRLGARSLFTSSQIPGEIFDLLVLRADAYERYQAHLKDLAGAWFRVLDELHAAPTETAAALGRRTQTRGADMLRALAGLTLPDRAENRRLLTGAEPAIAQPLQRLGQLMQHQDLLRHPAQPERLLPKGLERILTA